MASSEVLNHFSVDEVIAWLNAQNLDDLYICYNCCDLVRGYPIELSTTTSGDMQHFCSDCVQVCATCGVDHAPSMAWFHEDCEEEQ